MRRKIIISGCHCQYCRRHSSYAKDKIRRKIHSVRHSIKQFLKTGEYDKAQDILKSTGYTD